MIRYRYAQHLNPPAPFVYVALRCPQTGSRAENLAAQIDTAADRTVLPGSVIRSLGLVEDGRMLFQGFASDVVELPIFLVEVHIHDRPAVAVRAALGEHEPHILLGRDVLNVHRILLDGPQSALEIDS
jgi:predicted aspartyl protease